MNEIFLELLLYMIGGILGLAVVCLLALIAETVISFRSKPQNQMESRGYYGDERG